MLLNQRRVLKTSAGDLFPIYSCVDLTNKGCLNSIGLYGLITDSESNKTVRLFDDGTEVCFDGQHPAGGMEMGIGKEVH
jgi:hypothetical protein